MSGGKGRAGEQAARRYLESKGYAFVAANQRVGRDEIDLILRDGGTLVFVEVKLRSNGESGRAAVDAGKQRRISRAAVVYMAERGLLGSAARFDVVEAEYDGAAMRLHHITDAFPLARGRYFV